MSDLHKKFLLDDARGLSPNGRYAGLAAFGKHPGWDDHVEDLGLETDSLNLAKTVLYVNGIGGQIDSGAWEKLEPAQQLPGFKHVFVWQRARQILVGRLWSSSDGKGRKRYPMVVCAHFIGVTLGWALKQALPVLAELEAGCVQAATAEEVRSLLAQKRAALREAVQSAEGTGEYAAVSPSALNQILRGGGEAATQGFLRVLYQMQGQLAGFGPGMESSATTRAQQIRVPFAAENLEEALLFWTRFFLTQVDADVPLLLTVPLDAGWLDVTAGEPESHEFFCLRASPKSVPLVSEVPYNLDETFRTRARAFLDGFERGEMSAAALKPPEVQKDPTTVVTKPGLLKWVVLGVVLVLIVVVAIVLSSNRGKSGDAGKATLPAEPQKQPVTVPTPTTNEAKPEPPKPSAKELEAEATRRVEEEQAAAALAAAAKLKADTEAAARERERQLAEEAQKAREQELARQRQLEERRKLAEAAEAKRKADEAAAALAAAAASKTNEPPRAEASSPSVSNAAGLPEVTNSIGMALVRLPSGLWVGKFEVTQAEYQKVMGENPSKWKHDHQPVEWITFEDAQEFCRKLSELEKGKSPSGVYKLPTEAQWTDFRGGQKFEDLPALTSPKSEPSLVGQSGPANKFGLFDVLGNVWEWCLDAPPERQLKGGAFNNFRYYDQAAPLGGKGSNCGFRCVVVKE